MLPEEVLSAAMREIDTIVKKKISKATLEKPRFIDDKGKVLHGYEIYKLMQKPSDNNLRNIIHVSNAIYEFEQTSSMSDLAYWKELTKRGVTFDTVVESLNTSLSIGSVMTLAKYVRTRSNTVHHQSIANDIMKLDSTNTTVSEITTIIKNHERIDLTDDDKDTADTNYSGVTMEAGMAYYFGMKAGMGRINYKVIIICCTYINLH